MDLKIETENCPQNTSLQEQKNVHIYLHQYIERVNYAEEFKKFKKEIMFLVLGPNDDVIEEVDFAFIWIQYVLNKNVYLFIYIIYIL